MIATAEPTVFVLDVDPAVRVSLDKLLGVARLRIESYASPEEFLALYDPGRAGCLVLDVRNTGISGLELRGRLHHGAIDLPVIVLTGNPDGRMTEKTDSIGEPHHGRELLERIRSAIDADARIRQENADLAQISSRIASLTAPERQVMDLLVEGYSNKAMAARLHIARRTVEDRRARIMAKMGVESLAELVRLIAKRSPSTTVS